MTGNFIKRGKVKEIYDAGADALEFRFTDQISIFDKIIPNMIPHKGETLCRTAEYWFHRAEKLGIKTHFISRDAPDRMLVKKVSVIHDYSGINSHTKNYLIPLEVICRHYVSGSLHDRLKSGEADYKALGFSSLPKYGEKLPEPLFEVTTKLEEVDRKLEVAEALKISGLTPKELDDIKEAVLKIDIDMAQDAGSRGLIHVDGKKEFAFDKERRLMVIDTYGTPDEDRFWDAKEYENGECIELSKEFVRRIYRESGYHEKLMRARKEGAAEPPMPKMSDAEVKAVSDLYIEMFYRLTGEKFRH